TIRHFHGLCSDFCKEAGIGFYPEGDSQEFWRYKAPDRFMQALDKIEKRYDAIVVDEGQDFYPEWWLPLELLNKEGDKGPLYVFYDPEQNLFVKDDLSTPDLGVPYELPTNCRNTKHIAEVCSKVKGIEIRVRSDAPDGVECKIQIAESEDKQMGLCTKWISEWIGKGGLKTSQVVILGAHAKSHSSLKDASAIGKYPITQHLGHWESDKGILYASIRSFKGLEADAVIMIDIPEPDSIPNFTRSDFYVGCSRAKHLLVILGNSPYVI
ncbi:MAG TPA: hypothetical protein ENN58_02450, partial [bacterium]|nr:hypothetical protein [bacterium]